MFRIIQRVAKKNNIITMIQKQTFLTNDYKCIEAWRAQISSPILDKINLNDFYNIIDQNYSSKGVISALDVDLFVNVLKEPIYLEELKDLLHKLRLSGETGKTLDSTHHATIRNFIEFGNVEELIEILRNPIEFGIFLDSFTANILLDQLIKTEKYELAANVSGLIMLQEDYTNDITCALCQYACYKYIDSFVPPPPPPPPEGKPKKPEEIKVRVKYLRNPYFDDHFDIKDTLTLSGKTLAWISQRSNNNLNKNVEIMGWLFYKKYDKLLTACEEFSRDSSSKLFPDIIQIIEKEANNVSEDEKVVLLKCKTMLQNVKSAEVLLEEALKINIENAINKTQKRDIEEQHKLFKNWSAIREQRYQEQTKRLDRARRTQIVQEKQKQLEEEEQKLWFFDNQEKIELQIEEKEKLIEKPTEKKKVAKKSDDNYIPPEIVRQKK